MGRCSSSGLTVQLWHVQGNVGDKRRWPGRTQDDASDVTPMNLRLGAPE